MNNIFINKKCTFQYISYASDIDTVTANLTVSNNTVSGSITGIKPGSNRYLRVDAKNSSGTVAYQGTAGPFTINANELTPVTITLYELSGGVTVNGTFADSIPTNGLIAYYPFNGNANDESDNSYNGTVSGAALTTDKSGNSNKAYRFDGSNDYIDVTDDGSLSGVDSITVSCWFNADSFYPDRDGGVTLISKSYVGDASTLTDCYEIQMFQPSNSTERRIYVGAWNGTSIGTFYSVVNIEISQWYHVAFTYDNSIIRLYLNDTEIDSSAFTGTLNSNTSVPLRFGDLNGKSEKFDGKIDEIRIYNRALSSDEIQAIYNGN